MALSEENQFKVSQILGVSPSHIEYQLSLLSTDFTSTRQTAVEDQIERFDGITDDFTNIHPNLKNFGAEIKYNDQKNDIRKNLAVLLERLDWAGGNTMRLQRS